MKARKNSAKESRLATLFGDFDEEEEDQADEQAEEEEEEEEEEDLDGTPIVKRLWYIATFHDDNFGPATAG